MDLEAQIAEAIRTELSRQTEESQGRLTVADADQGLEIHGPVDIEALAMAIAGSVAGGP
jgi:hypothetical protein